ncbi:HAD family hydrolase [Streptomyces sp. BBFR102]|uniref:HAD family hydrolase n=1 Tax=Streptomyces sp. BBFR102 TaxID=3448171 RepID=UPI003F53DCE8
MPITTPHIVWDWNGTLFHDTEAVVGATNAAFAEFGVAPITLEQYRELYCVPIPRFYARMMGRTPTADEWEAMDGVFHRYYEEHRTRCGLAEGAEALLKGWGQAGHSQSILSMHGHEELVPLVRELGIDRHFLRVEGRTGTAGGSKAAHMERHLGALDAVRAEHAVVIGDAADDAVAAHAVGARAVLYTGGTHSRGRLEGTGAVVVDTLAEAVEVAHGVFAQG